MKEKGIATAVMAAVVVIIVIVAGIGAYFTLKGPEGDAPPAGDEEEGGGEEGDGAPQEGAFTLSAPICTTDNSTLLLWPQSTAADFVSYEIYQSTSSGVLRDRIATITDKETVSSITPSILLLKMPNTNSYAITSLSPSTIYYFTVRVNLAGGAYEDSDQVSVETFPERDAKWTFEGLRLSGEFVDPEVFQLPDNTYCMYHGKVAYSPDGLTWTVEPGEEPVALGTSIIKLPDGRYRAWWSIDKGAEEFDIKTAVSSDGYNWENETLCTSLNMEEFYGALPAVVLSPEGTYRMYYTHTETIDGENEVKRIYSAHSSDGLVWDPDPGIRVDDASSCDVYIREDGKYEMVDGDWTVSDDGLNWTRMGYTGIEGVDRIINVFPDGTVRMYYSNWMPGLVGGTPSIDGREAGIYSAIREPI